MDPPSGCDPLVPEVCAFPFPSSYFLETAQTSTGFQVAFSPEAMPARVSGERLDPKYWNERDGFSINSHLMLYFEDVSLEGVIGHQSLETYSSEEALTVIIDVARGERVPHFVELKPAQRPGEETLLMRPVVPLRFDAEYVVGIRGLVDSAGEPITPSTGFQLLREGKPSDQNDLEKRRAHYESQVFPALESQGFSRRELQLAWPFHTASEENTLGRIRWMRDDALERTAGGASYVIDKVRERSCSGDKHIARSVEGRITGPMYTEEQGPPTLLTRDDKGMPFFNGETEIPFIVQIPCSLMEEQRPGRLVQFGHGLLGWYEEIYDDYLEELADENGWIMFGVPWRGMAVEDRDAITLMLVTDPSEVAIVAERSMQGFVNMAVAMELMQGSFRDDDEMSLDSGESLISATETGYYGNSQGGVLGGGYLAMSPVIQRGFLGVAGAPFAMLLDRSADFLAFVILLNQTMEDEREVTLFVDGLAQHLWDPAEAGGWLRAMNESPEFFSKDVLLHVALGDAEVPDLGAHVMARAYGADSLAPQVRPIFGIDEREEGFSGSAIVEWRYVDSPDSPVGPMPPSTNFSPHECLRREPLAMSQVGVFMNTGELVQTCDGECSSVYCGL